MERPRFTTPRLILRPRELGDLAACVEINSDPAVMRYIGPVWPPDQQRTHLAKQIDDDLGPGLGHWTIRLRDGNEVLGWVMLAQAERSAEPELGYRLKPAAWGRGIATEAARTVLDYGLVERRLGSVHAIAHRDNIASHKVLRTLGFGAVGAATRGPFPEILFRVRGR